MATFRKANAQTPRAAQGYILLTLLLFVAVMVITAAAVIPSITFQIKREREEEMIHRGVQYSRAIRRYVKKFGRYPTRIEELESTNHVRFLRKRYKDPITNADFKLLHLGEVQLTQGAGVAGAATLGTPIGGQPGLGQQPAATPDASGKPKPNPSGSTGTDKLSSQVFGGGPIVGVASTSKEQTIREFNNKNHYNQWQFIYDPASDRGGLLNTPAQPPLQGAVPLQGAQGVSGQPVQPGQAPPQMVPAQPQPPPEQPPQQEPEQ